MSEPFYIKDPRVIYERSFALARAATDLSKLPAELHAIALRLVHTTGDGSVIERLFAAPGAVAAATRALMQGAPILTDTRMVAAGIMGKALYKANPIRCLLDAPGSLELAKISGITHSAAAVELSAGEFPGSIVAIGNAPTALFRILAMLDEGVPPPLCILGFPVGFVGAAESKACLQSRFDVPWITLAGRQGGSALAVAAINALAIAGEHWNEECVG